MKQQEELNEAWCNYMGKCSIEIMQALAFALRWADEHPHWISVRDKLPPKKSEYDGLSNNVLATNGKEIYESVYNHDFEDWFTHDMWGLDNITHWMPMPSIEHLRETTKVIEKGGEE